MKPTASTCPMEPTNITIFATDQTAQQFLTFQEHFDVFQALEKYNAFEIKSGYATLHFDSLGRVGSVDIFRHYKC